MQANALRTAFYLLREGLDHDFVDRKSLITGELFVSKNRIILSFYVQDAYSNLDGVSFDDMIAVGVRVNFGDFSWAYIKHVI